MTVLIIFVKYPQPGKVKTRLGATIGMELAAEFYRVFVEQTFQLAKRCSFDAIFVAFEPAERETEILAMIPAGLKCFPQKGAHLGQRLEHAFTSAFSNGAAHVIAIGSDSPTLPAQHVAEARAKLRTHDLVLGPAEDGGYYLIGLNQVQSPLFQDIPWSSDSVLESTVAAANRLELSCFLLEKWYDVDDLTTLRRAAKDDRSGRIASLLHKVVEP